MQVVNISTMQGMIKHVAIKKRRPIYFHGASGIGKSEGIAQCAADHDAPLIDIRVSQYESVDFRGIPDIQGGTTIWNMPATLPFKGNAKFELCDPDKPIFLFFDEVNQGDPSVLSVMYQLINDRRVGEHELMDNVIMICAGNRGQDRGTTNKFPAPLANRMTHAELIPDIKSWTAWASKASKSPTLIGFLNFRSELLHTFDPAKAETVFATPRTWNFVNDDFIDTDMPDDVRIASIAGSVGEGPATELQGFAKIMDSLVPIEQIIANPTKVPVSPEMDIQWALATHVSTHMSEETADPLHEFLQRLEPEMVVLAWTLAINRDPMVSNTNAFLYKYAQQYRGLFMN